MQFERDFIELVDFDLHRSSRVHYIPHQAVWKDSDTTPVRVVFDCSAELSKSSPSLNECLLKGSPDINDMGSILLRARVDPFACTADLEKAFLMVGLNETDRDCCRFFWPQNPFDKNSKMLVYRFKVVLFGSVSSQFLLNSTLNHHLDKYSVETSHKIKRNLYVDNTLATFK